jgi:hypothetical protein
MRISACLFLAGVIAIIEIGLVFPRCRKKKEKLKYSLVMSAVDSVIFFFKKRTLSASPFFLKNKIKNKKQKTRNNLKQLDG